MADNTQENINQEHVDAACGSDTTQKDSSLFKPKHRRRHRRHDADDMAGKMEEMNARLSEANDKYLHIMADFENYRRHSNAQRNELILNGGKDVIKEVLTVVDDLERALPTMNDAVDKEGVNMIYSKLMKILGQRGLKAIEAKGTQFDETLHEAVMQIPATEEQPKGTVVDVIEKGYYLNDKVLRFAKVVVAV